MKTILRVLFVLVLVCMTWIMPVSAEELTAGVAVADITPPTGYRLSGYFHERSSTGTHDPLLVKAVVFQQGNVSAALAFCDVIGVSPEVSSAARSQASAKCGIPIENILVAATHSHTGPLYSGTFRDMYHELALERHGEDALESVDYTAVLADKIVTAIAVAQAKAKPVLLETAEISQEGLSFNRRFHMKGGGPVRFNPGKLNPNIDRVAGPVDPEVGFLLARTAADNAPLFSLSVFALHLDTVGGTEYSADYPHYLEESLQLALGQDLVSLFGIGACGDINHVDVSHKRPQKGHTEAARIGITLGSTIINELDLLQEVNAPALAVRSIEVPVPLKPFTDEEVAQAKALLLKAETTRIPFMERVVARRTMRLAYRNTDALPMTVQVFRLNKEVAVVGLPGEIFVELSLAIREASPFAKTIVIALANDTPAYIPTTKAMAEGSYETENCIIQPGGGEMLVEAAVQLLNELHG